MKSFPRRRESRDAKHFERQNNEVVPAQAGIQWSASDDWVPACAGMTWSWVPACAGMTWSWVPACAGMTLTGAPKPSRLHSKQVLGLNVPQVQ